MDERPSRTVMIVGGLVVGAVWIGSGVMAYRGTWWPLIVVLAIAGSAGVLSMGIALFVRAKSGRSLAGAQLERQGGAPGPRAAPVRGSAVPQAARQGKRPRPKNRKRRGR
jgi:hypothetical protein